MNRRNLLIRTGGLVAVGGAVWWARDHLLWPKPTLIFDPHGATPWLPYVLEPSNVSLEVTIGDTVVPAIIDTGAQRSVIDKTLFEALPHEAWRGFEAPLVVYGVGGGASLGRGVNLDLRLPGLKIEGLRTGVLDLGDLPAAGLNAALVIGQDILAGLVLAMDPARRYVRLIRRDVFVRPPDLAPAPVRLKDGGLVTQVTVEGTVVEALIDTGASGVLGLSRAAAKGAGLLDGRASREGRSVVLGRPLRSMIVDARSVTFADQLYEATPVYVYDRPPLGTGAHALIGIDAFADRRAALDLGEGTLHIARPLDLTIGL